MSDTNPYSAADIASCITAARQLLNYPSALRPVKTRLKKPGNILVLPPRPTYVVGDLHANRDNLRQLIAYCQANRVFQNANLLLLGDLLHSAIKPNDALASLDTLVQVLHLMVSYPEHVFLLRGNHETIRDGIVKGGLDQSRLFNDFIRHTYGQPPLFELGKLFNELPVLALGESLVACHAGPAPGASYQGLLDADVGDDSYKALIDSRNYSARDVALFIKALSHHPYPYTAKTLFVVGHHRLPNEQSIQGGFKGIDYHFALQSYYKQGFRLLKLDGAALDVIDLPNPTSL